MIFKITPDSITIVKSLPTPVEEYDWFPLTIGNTWVYDSYELDGISSQFTGTKYMNIAKDTLIESRQYFVVENNLTSAIVFPQEMYLRVDSASGFIYRYWEELNDEFIFHNLCDEVGDVIQYPLNPDEPYYFLEYEQPINYFGINTSERWYPENGLCTCHHNLIKGFGLGRTLFWEITGEENILKGCVINGVLYGDTTFVVNVEEEQNTISTEYKLEQNYPNPFNPGTKISWQAPVSSWQTIKLYNALGKEVDTIVDEYLQAGFHSKLYIVNSTLPSGVYFYQLKAGEYVETKKMILLK